MLGHLYKKVKKDIFTFIINNDFGAKLNSFR